MKCYTNAEICLMLLCVLPGDTPPLGMSMYRRLLHAVEGLGNRNTDPEAELDAAELRHLGCSAAEAEEILHRLSQTDALRLFLSGMERQGIAVITRISPEYPQMLWQKLGDRAPLVLYCAGNVELFSKKCISLVGSRKLRQPGRLFSETAGKWIAQQGNCYCSGGAAGADSVGYEAAIRAGGTALVFLADSLRECMERERYQNALRENRVLLVSEYGYDQPFSAARAMSRNRLIHAMGEKVLIAQSDYAVGGTWRGTLDNLKAQWSPCFMCNEEAEDAGTIGLLERGCIPILTSQLHTLSLQKMQTSLFDECVRNNERRLYQQP